MADADFTIELINAISSSAQQASADMRGLREELAGAKEHSEALDFALGGLLQESITKVAEVALEAAKAVAELALKFGEASVESAAFGQKAELAIGNLTHDMPQAAARFDEVRHMAQGLGLDVDSTVESFQELLAAQFSAGQSESLIKMAADMQSIGADGQKVKSIFLALSQIKSIGVLQGGDLRQLEQAGISGKLVYEQLGKALGKTTEEIASMQRAGKITADEGIAAIMAAVQEKVGETNLGDVGEKFANQTLEGMWNQLKGGVSNLFIDIGRAILPTLQDLAGSIGEIIGDIAKDPAIQQLGTYLLNEFEYFALWVKANMPEIKEFIIGAVDAIAASIRFVVGVVDFAATHWETIKLVLEGVGAVLGIVAAAGVVLMAPLFLAIGAIAALVGGLVELVSYVVGNIGTWFSAIGAWFTGIWDSISAAVSNAWPTVVETFKSLGMALLDGLTFGMASNIGNVISAVTGIAGRAKDAFKSALGIASPSKVFAELGGHITSGLTVGLADGAGDVETATADVGAAAVSGASTGAAGGGMGSPVFAPVYQFPEGSLQGMSAEQIADMVSARTMRDFQRFLAGAAA